MGEIMKKSKSLSSLLVPDYMFDTFEDVTPEFLKSIGVRALLIDIDNTLAPYEQAEPDERIINWFASLAENGLRKKVENGLIIFDEEHDEKEYRERMAYELSVIESMGYSEYFLIVRTI